MKKKQKVEKPQTIILGVKDLTGKEQLKLLLMLFDFAHVDLPSDKILYLSIGTKKKKGELKFTPIVIK